MAGIMASWSILAVLVVSLFRTGDSQEVGATCPIEDVRKELMELVVDHNTRLTNLISNMTRSELCRIVAECTSGDESVVNELPETAIKSPTQQTTSNKVVPKDAIDCLDLKTKGTHGSGVYNVTLGGRGLTSVFCDMDTDGGGWTVFQRRIDGEVDFYLGWNNYTDGFGSVTDEFWLGNENIHRLTSLGETELRVDLEDFEYNTAHANYESFYIGDASTYYRLRVSGYSGNASDSMSYHNGSSFSTKDSDHDGHSSSCAMSYHGAWWYKTCHYSNLNGQYLEGPTEVYAKGVTWYHWKGYYYSIKTSRMMARRVPEDQDRH